jgi:hypothetical protein
LQSGLRGHLKGRLRFRFGFDTRNERTQRRKDAGLETAFPLGRRLEYRPILGSDPKYDLTAKG